MKDLLDRLARGEVVVGDGAWGTLLMERGLPSGEPPEVFNLGSTGVLEEIAALYLDAGAEIITTNTFGGSPLRLALHGLANQVEAINGNAVAAARRAVGDRAYVSASMGPSGRLLRPFGDVEPEAVAASFEKQATVLVNAGVDLVCIETMTDLDEATLAVKAVRRVSPDIPILATMTFEQTRRGFYTVMGVSIPAATAGLEAAGADVVGSNCGYGLETMIEVARALRQHSRLPLAIQANAGLPLTKDGATYYPESPADVSARTPDLLAAGVQIIGGCCGTTPAHIRAIRAVVDSRRG